jgi:hypothetical protein
MKIGQPKLSEGKSQRSGLFVPPTNAYLDLGQVLEDY